MLARSLAKNRSAGVPLTKLRANLATAAPEKTPVVLISTGSYAPVHRMHVEVFEAAKRWLEEHHDFVVVAGFMSPSHDQYVSSKMKRQGVAHITANHRVAMCKLALRDSSWLDVSEWEANQMMFVDFPDVTLFHAKHISAEVRKEAPSIVVMYLCGADHAFNCGLLHGISSTLPVVAVARPGYTERIGKLKRTEDRCYFVQLETEDVSSTIIRERLRNEQSVEDLTGAAVSAYIFENNLHKLFKKP